MPESPVDPQFVLEHAAHVRALARRLVFDGARADDLEQETWLAALGNAPREMTSPRGWLARIAARRVVHDWRAADRRDAREAEVARPDVVASSEVVIEREETRTEVVRAVLALDEPYRSALVAQFLEERKPGAAAKARDVPVETQRTQVKRGLEILRERMKRSHGFGFAAFQLALVRDLRLEAPFGATLAAAGTAIVGGGILMGAGKKVAVAAAVGLVAVLTFVRPWESIEGPRADGVTRVGPAALASSSEVESPTRDAERAASTSVAQAADSVMAVVDPTAKAAIVVLARVVDEHGRPLDRARGVLRARNGPWSAEVPQDARYEGVTDSSGTLRIEAPPTTAKSVILEVDAGTYRTLGEFLFDESLLQRILPGVNDVGEIVTRPAGGVEGRILGGGVVLEGVLVSPRFEVGSRRTTPRAKADREGRFVLEHLPEGSTRMQFLFPGFVTRDVDVVVVAGSVVDMGDIDLAPAPSIEGTVVDSRGEPLAGASVRAYAVDAHGRGLAASKADGAFRAFVEVEGAYDLEVAGDPRFRAWGGRGVDGARVRAGDRDVRIVLESTPITTFRVIAADDGAPVLEFGIDVQRDDARELSRDFGKFDEDRPRLERHASNELALPAEPGVHEVLVAAPGFVPARHAIVHDAPGSPVQTLRLERGRALRGRLVRDGAPLAAAQVTVGRALVPLGPKPSRKGVREIGLTHAWDLGSFLGRSRTRTTGADGSFEFSGLAQGTYEVQIATGGALVRRVDLVRVEAEADTDLGEIAVSRGSTVRGRLDTGAASPAGWVITVTGRAPIVVDREDGRFELTGLPAGPIDVDWDHPQAFGLESRRGVDDQERLMHLELGDGEVREIVLDASAYAPARVTVRVRVDGALLSAGRLWLLMRTPDGVGTGSSRGPTGDTGSWTGLVRSGVPVSVYAATPDGLMLASTEYFVLTPGESREVVIDTQAGVVELRLPASLALPESGGVQASILSTAESRWSLSASKWTRNAPHMKPSNGEWTGHHIVLGRVGAGERLLQVQAFRYMANGSGGWTHEPLLPKFEVPITIRPGETTVVEMP